MARRGEGASKGLGRGGEGRPTKGVFTPAPGTPATSEQAPPRCFGCASHRPRAACTSGPPHGCIGCHGAGLRLSRRRSPALVTRSADRAAHFPFNVSKLLEIAFQSPLATDTATPTSLPTNSIAFLAFLIFLSLPCVLEIASLIC